jgi:hypothetical protein
VEVAATTTDAGFTAVIVRLLTPLPVPLVAVNEYAWVPTGRRMPRVKITPAK